MTADQSYIVSMILLFIESIGTVPFKAVRMAIPDGIDMALGKRQTR